MSRPKGARDAEYESKRQELLRRLTLRMMRREIARPSLRDLAAAAQVSVPTLRHYFGQRAEVVAAVLAEYHRAGRGRLDFIRVTEMAFADSIIDIARRIVRAFGEARQDIRLGDVFAVGLAEGLLDGDIAPSVLEHLIDPTVEALKARLDLHVARGEMIATDTRVAAMMLVSPLLVANLHQDQLCGAAATPLALSDMADEVSAGFIRGYRA